MKSAGTQNRTGHYISAILLVILGVALDQYTKQLAITHLKGQKPFVILNNIFELQYLENRGAAFGLLQNQQFFFFHQRCDHQHCNNLVLYKSSHKPEIFTASSLCRFHYGWRFRKLY